MGSHPASGGYKYKGLVLRDGGLGVGLTTLPCKKEIVEKPPRNSAGFCGEGQGLSWAVEPWKEEEEEGEDIIKHWILSRTIFTWVACHKYE
jgi:hypothetical protein